MKYIVTQTAHIFQANKKGVLHRSRGVVNKGSVLSGEIKKMSVSTPMGIAVKQFLEISSAKSGTIYIHAGFIAPYKSKAEGEYESSNISGAEAVAKIGGVDVLIPVAIFGGLGFVISSIIGENKIGLTLGGAVLGGLIGVSGSGSEQKMSASGRSRGKGASTQRQNNYCDMYEADGCADETKQSEHCNRLGHLCRNQSRSNAEGAGRQQRPSGRPAGEPTSSPRPRPSGTSGGGVGGGNRVKCCQGTTDNCDGGHFGCESCGSKQTCRPVD